MNSEGCNEGTEIWVPFAIFRSAMFFFWNCAKKSMWQHPCSRRSVAVFQRMPNELKAKRNYTHESPPIWSYWKIIWWFNRSPPPSKSSFHFLNQCCRQIVVTRQICLLEGGPTVEIFDFKFQDHWYQNWTMDYCWLCLVMGSHFADLETCDGIYIPISICFIMAQTNKNRLKM